MKYIATIDSDNELSEDAIRDLKSTVFVGDESAPYCFEITSIKQESCEDCVSRKAIIKALNEMDRYIADGLILCESGNKFPLNEVFIVDDVYEKIENLPSVTPQQKTGKWIKAYTEEKYISLRDKITVSTYMCSECGRMINNIGTGPFASRIEGYPYCHCGAKMIGVKK